MKHVTNTVRKMELRGTIIDFETTGDLNRSFSIPDPRYFGSIKPTIFGYLVGDIMVQYCAEGTNEIKNLIDIISETIPELDKPLYALNTAFEKHLLSKYCDLSPEFIDVRGEGIIAGKKWLRDRLNLSHYNDPFNCDGLECKIQWNNGNFIQCVVHNQACLQLERDILEIRLLKPKMYPF